jgi:molecular chaperone GrpE
LDAIPEDQLDQSWMKGITLIHRKLETTLDGYGVVSIEVESGEPFDPFIHEAVTFEEQEELNEGEIIATLQKGYRLGERVLRPAMVRVAK